MSWVVALAGLASVVLLALRWRWTPSWEYLRGRTADPEQWGRRYGPDLPTAMRVVEIVVDAFLLRSDDVERLRPEDQLLAIYRSAYPGGGADALETEELTRQLEQEFGLPCQQLEGRDMITMGELIDLCIDHQRQVDAGRAL